MVCEWWVDDERIGVSKGKGAKAMKVSVNVGAHASENDVNETNNRVNVTCECRRECAGRLIGLRSKDTNILGIVLGMGRILEAKKQSTSHLNGCLPHHTLA